MDSKTKRSNLVPCNDKDGQKYVKRGQGRDAYRMLYMAGCYMPRSQMEKSIKYARP